jgi:hypothetical protein
MNAIMRRRKAMNLLMRYALLGIALTIAFSVHAAKKIPLSDARYTDEINISSTASVSIELTTFTPAEQKWSDLAMSGGMFIPVFGKVKTDFLFNPPDQEALAGILRSEVERIGVFAPLSDEGQARAVIKLDFKEGTYKQLDNLYTLKLAMMLMDPEGRITVKEYDLNSHARLTGWQKANTSVWQGKMYLVQEALDAIIPDLQAALRDGTKVEEEGSP